MSKVILHRWRRCRCFRCLWDRCGRALFPGALPGSGSVKLFPLQLPSASPPLGWEVLSQLKRQVISGALMQRSQIDPCRRPSWCFLNLDDHFCSSLLLICTDTIRLSCFHSLNLVLHSLSFLRSHKMKYNYPHALDTCCMNLMSISGIFEGSLYADAFNTSESIRYLIANSCDVKLVSSIHNLLYVTCNAFS